MRLSLTSSNGADASGSLGYCWAPQDHRLSDMVVIDPRKPGWCIHFSLIVFMRMSTLLGLIILRVPPH